jgi:glycosyltransferase involved in cell wall biosynthesis
MSEQPDVAAAQSRAPVGGAVAPLRVAVVGVSTSRMCGVRDHAVLLADALAEENVNCSLHWLWPEARSLGHARSEVRSWTRQLKATLERGDYDAILLHYSVFAHAYRGLPIFVRPLLSALGASRIPLVTILHEYAYPWRRGGLRGTAWAVTQRAVLFGVMRASAAVVVTAYFRAEWLASRAWLPRRRTVVAPVFSNLPPARAVAPRGQLVGLFGYGHDGAAMPLVVDAMRLLYDRGVEARLVLLGAPGRTSPAGEAWSSAAQARGVAGSLSFSGTLAAQELSDALSECEVLLSAEPSGPTSRKTTLAASLASGRPVVALDGQLRWQELIESDAAVVVPATADALADALAALLGDEDLRESVGTRGRVFAKRTMDVQYSAREVSWLLDLATTNPLTAPRLPHGSRPQIRRLGRRRKARSRGPRGRS